MTVGTVESIFIAAEAESATQPIEAVEAVAGRGLEGDRYFAGGGTFFKERKSGQDLTLIEAEAIEGMARATCSRAASA